MVSIRQWLTDADGIKTYTLVRSEFVEHECASMLAVIPALVWPGIKVEIEVVAVGHRLPAETSHPAGTSPGQLSTPASRPTAKRPGGVTDRSGDGAPVLLPAAFADGEAEGSPGIGLVDSCAARWGCWRGGGFTTTWFKLRRAETCSPDPAYT